MRRRQGLQQAENREKTTGVFFLGWFWLFPYVWEEGSDNCYLGGEQRKQLHQGKAGYPYAAETRSSRANASTLNQQHSPSKVPFSLFPVLSPPVL